MKSSVILSSLVMFSHTVSAQNLLKPNFVIIMADDLGYGDLSCHGGKTPTPNLDKLMGQGVEFRNFMTWAVCSPTRAGLLTGLNPLRTGQGPNTDGQLTTNIPTIGNIFQKNGYKTGIFGKWHNGNAPKFYPLLPHVNDYGFDRWVGFYGGGIDYFTKVWPNNITGPCWYHDKTEVNTEREYSTDLLTKYSLEFIEKNKMQPFLAYIPYNTVHTPLHVKETDLKRVPASIVAAAGGKLRTWREYYKLTNDLNFKQLNDAYFQLTGDSTIFSIKGELSEADLQVLYSAMIINLDDKVGEILNYLDDNNLSKNTVVLFFSDNGATPTGSSLPFQGNKHSVYEGGVHSPAVIRWPQGEIAGSRTFGPMVGYLDILPTFLEMAGIKDDVVNKIDGTSFFQELKLQTQKGKREYYWVWRDHDVIRTDQWKLFRYVDRNELFDISGDISESKNVADSNPLVVADLISKLEVWRESTGMAITHLAPKIKTEIKPSPRDAVLKITADCQINANNPELIIQLSSKPFMLLPGDYLHFDIMAENTSKQEGFLITPYFNNSRYFTLKRGVDQFGRLQISGPAPLNGPGIWEHRVIGLGNEAPGSINKFSLYIRKTGKYSILIDNIQIHRADGSITNIWDNSDKVSKDKPLSIINETSDYKLTAFYWDLNTTAENISVENQIKFIYGNTALELISSNKNIERCFVYSMDNKLVLHSEPRSKTCILSYNSLKPGVYVVSVTLNGRVFNQKIVIHNH